ncbi:MAG TPA: flavin reductase family protein [Gemmataceae bacterium]|jgi:flavin reductase (DIM6/NTAB) family NADH-FMN oxidoreductase RutF|nr:flavin reductase family protein [Gemmataceae bacterium]
MTDSEPQKQLAAALGRIPSGIFVVTARRGQSETGILASWVQQCGFDPPSISLAFRRDRIIVPWLTVGAPITVNILDDGQTDMIVHFGRGFALDEPAFDGLDVDRPNGEAPILCEAVAYLQCTISGAIPAGDHELFVGRVVAGKILNEGHPMVHIRRSGFHY